MRTVIVGKRELDKLLKGHPEHHDGTCHKQQKSKVASKQGALLISNRQ
jgi:hypothetical protein